MFAALALLSCFSAWQAWRHTPLYSSRSALVLIGKIMLMMAAASAAIILTTLLTSGRSLPVQIGGMLLSILVCTLGLVFGITAAATPRIARLQTQLPAGVPIQQLHRQRVTHWLRIALIYFAMCGLLALAPDPLRSFALVLGLMGFLLSAVMLPVGYVTARRMDRAVTALELTPWLHWQYPPAARSIWCKAQVERMKLKSSTFILRRDWLKLLGLCALIVVPSLLMTYGSVIARAGWGFGCCVFLGLFIQLAAFEERRAPQRLARRLAVTPPDAWFGRDGVVCDGHFYTWIDTSAYLNSATIDWRPPRSVCFDFTHITPGAFGASSAGKFMQNVLIPPDVGSDDWLCCSSSCTLVAPMPSSNWLKNYRCATAVSAAFGCTCPTWH